MNRPLLVLDIDETLLYASEARLDREPDHIVGSYFVYRRPGLSQFFDVISTCYDLAVWTSSSPRYADEVCRLVFSDPTRLQFIWASDRCTPVISYEDGSVTLAKRLAKLRRIGYDLDRILIVDDSPEKHTKNYGNLVQVTPYNGGLDDDELERLGIYLRELSGLANLRKVEKRSWRRHVAVS